MTPDVREAFWGVPDTAIAFVVRGGPDSPDGPLLRFLNLRSRRVTTVAALPSKGISSKDSSLPATHDGRSGPKWIAGTADLVMIDPWRP